MPNPSTPSPRGQPHTATQTADQDAARRPQQAYIAPRDCTAWEQAKIAERRQPLRAWTPAGMLTIIGASGQYPYCAQLVTLDRFPGQLAAVHPAGFVVLN